ncbi:MAG: HAMP domain-containing sensor histidine kinase [Ignavibacteriaceae bacterium]|jgi:signal transduction histidine kinase
MDSKNKIFFQHKILEGTTGNQSRANDLMENPGSHPLLQTEGISIAGFFGQNDFQSVSISESDNLSAESKSFTLNSESCNVYEWFDSGAKQINNISRVSSFDASAKSEMFMFWSSVCDVIPEDEENFHARAAENMKMPVSSENIFEELHDLLTLNQIDLLKENILLKKNLLQSQKENEELVELNRSKNGLLSIISHDLKNPFGALLNMSEFLATETDDMERIEIGEFAQAINISAKILYKFFNDLLEWSKLQNGIVNVNPVTLDVRTVVDNIFSLLNITAMSKGVKLVNNIPLGTNLLGDLNMINSIINNLVTNAIKFTNAGGSVIVHAQELDGFVELAVMDDGVGMGENVLEKIFKLNKHITHNGTENEVGSGLGLVITKDLVTRHGGKIWVESSKGTGTSFYFTLPKGKIFAEVA